VTCPLRGKASGHGVGMCQMGAIEIARHGYPAQIILGHYFPGTTIEAATMTSPKSPPMSRAQISAAATVHPPQVARSAVHTPSPAHTTSVALTASAGTDARAAQ
jgi:hypothetical protein